MRASSVGWGFLAFIVGALPAFALAGPALYGGVGADGIALRLAGYALALFVFALGGGALEPSRRLAVAIGISLPVVAVVLLADWSDAGTVALNVGLVAGAAATAWAGAAAGATVTARVMARRAGERAARPRRR